MQQSRFAGLFFVLLISGCASTTTVRQANSLADAGIAYGTASQEVIALTRDRYVDWQSTSLMEEIIDREHCTTEEIAGGTTPSDDCEQLIRHFDLSHQNSKELYEQFSNLSDHARLLGQYFHALKTLATYDSAANSGAAAGRLVDRINALGGKLEEKVQISPAQRTGWANLAGLVGDTVKASIIRDRLKADAESIGRAIDIQSAVLEANLAVLSNLDRAKRLKAFEQGVRVPYLTGSVTDGPRWISRRRQLLAPGPEIAQVKALQSASKSLQEVWTEILSGNGNPQAATEVLDEISRALRIVDEVRRANATPTKE